MSFHVSRASSLSTLKKITKCEAADKDDWTTALEVLESKPYLANCIPEKSAWGVLHQAVFHNKEDAVKKILDFKTCDAKIKSRQAYRDMLPGITPLEIANKLEGRDKIKEMIQKNIKDSRDERFKADFSYTVSRQDGEKKLDELPLFIRAISLYKETILGKDKPIPEIMTELLKQIFNGEQNNWKSVKTELQLSLYGFDKAAVDKMLGIKSDKELFEKIIKLYTENTVYQQVKRAMAKEFLQNYNPEAEEMALGLYATLFDVTITFWKNLKTTEGIVYRGVANRLGDFIKGQEIMFATIASSSGRESKAKEYAQGSGTLFIFDNSADTFTRPRHIAPYSDYDEDEYVYPIGAVFKVEENEIKDGLRVIKLKLLGDCKFCNKNLM